MDQIQEVETIMEKLNPQQILTLPNGITILRVLAIPSSFSRFFIRVEDINFLPPCSFLELQSQIHSMDISPDAGEW